MKQLELPFDEKVQEEYQTYFDYLDNLRDSGVVNMWLAAGYLEKEFDIPERDAKIIHIAWIRSYGDK